jgi:hypothetical protein
VDLFRTSAQDTPIVLEECDHLFASEGCLNVLKLATERHGQSIQVYVGAKSARARGTWETVQLTAPVTFTLNNYLTDLAVWPKECRNHIQALCSREPPLTITADRAAQWEYAIYLATVEQMLRYTEGPDQPNPLDIQNAAMRWFSENVWRLSEVSPRRLTKIMRTMMMHHRTGYRWGRGALKEELEQFLDVSLTDRRPVPTAPQILLGREMSAPCGVSSFLRH